MVVVGAGISGLAAAHDLVDGDTEVVVLEGSDRVGGKLRLAEVAGVSVDVGAESALARVPEALDLMAALGLGAEIVHPATTAASIAVEGRHVAIPSGTQMGVPADLDALRASGLLSEQGLATVVADPVEPGAPVTADVSVAALVGGRLGRELLDRLVAPLLGGVYAGDAERLSVRATMPALWPHLATTGSLVTAARAARVAAAVNDGPVFASVPAGLGSLPPLLAATPGVTVRTGTTARELTRTAHGFLITAGPAPRPVHLEADAVVLAVPPGKAAGLLRGVAPDAAGTLGEIETASMAVVTLAVPRQDFPPGSGLLVASPNAGAVKAVTLSSQKWAHLDTHDVAFVRASVGRRGEEHVLQRSDDELIALVRKELGELVGLRGTPVDALVTRWGGGLPQYDVGHLDRVERILAAVSAVPGLAVCGAAYAGVGVAACIRFAHHAAAAIRGQWAHG